MLADLQRELETARLSGRDAENELNDLRRKITRYEEIVREHSNCEAKIRLLTEEIERLNETVEDLTQQMNMYKQKYVEFSNMVERVNNTMALYVLTCAQMEALKRQLGNPEERKSRASISEQLSALNALGGSSQSTRTVKVTEEYI